MPARWLGSLALTLCALALSGCGSTAPEPLKPMAPDVPADLCTWLPQKALSGLDTSATTAESGDPIASCSLRSKQGAKPLVRGLVTLVQLNDEDTADTTYQSQCSAIASDEYTVQKKLTLEGADEACAGKGKKIDSATLALVAGRNVVTVRFTSDPADKPDASTQAKALAEAVLSEASGGTASDSASETAPG